MQPFVQILHQFNNRMKIHKIKHDEKSNNCNRSTSFNLSQL